MITNHSIFVGVLSLALYFLVTPATASESDKFRFVESQDCNLTKEENHRWVPVHGSEISNKPFSVRVAKENETQFVFSVGDAWYSASSRCVKPVASEARELAQVKPEENNRENNEEKKDENRHERLENDSNKEKEIKGEYEDISERQHQAAARVFEITPAIAGQSLSLKNNPANSTVTGIDNFTWLAGFIAEYGLNEHFSLGAGINYVHENIASNRVDGSVSILGKGLGDPTVFGNYRLNVGPGLLKLQVPFTFSLSHFKIDSVGNTNESSGGKVLSPILGYEMGFASSIVGAQVQYDAMKSDRTVDDSSSGTLITSLNQGGKTFVGTLFYEYHPEPWVFGIALSYAHASSTTTVSNGTPVDNADSGSAYIGQFYTSVELSSKITLLPAVTYTIPKFYPQTNSSTQFSSAHVLNVSFGARFAF